MARKLVGRPPDAAVEQLVRRVLDDPQAKLVFWLPRSEQFVDRHGTVVVLDPAFDGLTWRAFGHGDAKVLAIVHDVELSEDPELLEAVGAASLLALESRRLEHDLVDSVDALRASQRRLVGAASAERRKIERDLHDGVQQKLVALRIELELARDLVDDGGLGGRLAELAADFDDALDELRSAAHGIYPPLLADEGLEAALREIARRSTVPLTVDLEDVGRLSEDRETAIYYCCLEALQNVAKHGGDGAAASLRLWRDRKAVRFSVSDDGVGFFPRRPAAQGAGLTNMTDRIGAVGGTLAVRSPRVKGRRFRAPSPSRRAIGSAMSSTSEQPRRTALYRLVVAEDAYLIREGIRSALEREGEEVEVLEYCPDLGSLLRAVEMHRPNVVITDIRMPPTNSDEGIQAAVELRESHPEIGVVVISQYVSPHYALKLFEHGSAGRAYLLKEHVGHRIQLMEAIREVSAGGSVVDPKVVDVLVEARMRARNSLLARLSAREREVLAGVATGASNAAIAESLFLTKRAVEKNINSLFAKLDLTDDKTTSRRVRAALLFLADSDLEAGPEVGPEL